MQGTEEMANNTITEEDEITENVHPHYVKYSKHKFKKYYIEMGYTEHIPENDGKSPQSHNTDNNHAVSEDMKLYIETPNIELLTRTHNLDTKLDFLDDCCKITKCENAQVYEGIRKCLDLILLKVAQSDPCMTFEIFETGSSYDELKIGKLFEFDFMLENNQLLQKQGLFYKNNVLKDIYNVLDKINWPEGWQLECSLHLEKVYIPVGFADHPAAQMHRRGPKLWFKFSDQDELVLMDIIPCGRIDKPKVKLLDESTVNNLPFEVNPQDLLLFPDLDRGAGRKKISTSLLENKLVQHIHPNLRKIFRILKVLCYEYKILGNDSTKFHEKGYIASFFLKTIFLRILLKDDVILNTSATDKISTTEFVLYISKSLETIFSHALKQYFNHVHLHHFILCRQVTNKRVSFRKDNDDFRILQQKIALMIQDLEEGITGGAYKKLKQLLQNPSKWCCSASYQKALEPKSSFRNSLQIPPQVKLLNPAHLNRHKGSVIQREIQMPKYARKQTSHYRVYSDDVYDTKMADVDDYESDDYDQYEDYENARGKKLCGKRKQIMYRYHRK